MAAGERPSRAAAQRRPTTTWLLSAGLVAFAAGLAAVFSPGARALAQGGDVGEGATIYAENCVSCHQADGTGIPGTFPPLRGNPAVADTAYVEAVIQDGLSGPLDVNGEIYDSVMAAIVLSDDERSAVAAYVATLAPGSETTGTTTPAPPEPGDNAGGQSLFEGASRFENGGAACVGCHTAGEVGNFGGPGLGPDLTDVFDELGGEVGLAAWLQSPPSQTMSPIFDDHPLTEGEIADVVAFLGVTPEQEKASSAVDWLTVGGLAATVALIGGMAIAWRGMRQTYVERLRSRQ